MHNIQQSVALLANFHPYLWDAKLKDVAKSPLCCYDSINGVLESSFYAIQSIRNYCPFFKYRIYALWPWRAIYFSMHSYEADDSISMTGNLALALAQVYLLWTTHHI